MIARPRSLTDFACARGVARSVALTALLATLPVAGAAQSSSSDVLAPQSYPLADSATLKVIGGKAEAAEYLGRKAVRLTTEAEDDSVVAYLNGSAFQDGVIEADVAAKSNRPPGARSPGFVGIAFRARPDGTHYDLFYIRPKNSVADDQAMRNHSVQYAAKPGYDWYPLRRKWPSIYEAWASLKPESWTHVKIEVHGRSARLFINGSELPSLVVNGTKGEDLAGGVALWGFAGEDTYFSNLHVNPEAPAPIHNGGEAAGKWNVVCNSDYGHFEGSMELHREGAALTGTWTGTFGDNLPVTGTWRNGYVELTFTGIWQEGLNAPQFPAVATLAGWIDDDNGAGRMKVEGRADGVWTAERKH